jgi:hypothetical protein
VNSVVDLLGTIPRGDVAKHQTIATIPPDTQPAKWNQDLFEQEQLRSLVRQVFFPGWSKSAKQVVFAAVDPHTAIHQTCLRIADALAAQTAGTICIVHADPATNEQKHESVFDESKALPAYGRTPQEPPAVQAKRESLRTSSRQISEKLWAMPMNIFLDGSFGGRSAVWLHGRLEQLRSDFDYTLLQAPAAAVSSEAALFGNLCDGVILVLQARSTRKFAAQRVRAMLNTANARLLGTILTERTFPIPERIYRKL